MVAIFWIPTSIGRAAHGVAPLAAYLLQIKTIKFCALPPGLAISVPAVPIFGIILGLHGDHTNVLAGVADEAGDIEHVNDFQRILSISINLSAIISLSLAFLYCKILPAKHNSSYQGGLAQERQRADAALLASYNGCCLATPLIFQRNCRKIFI